MHNKFNVPHALGVVPHVWWCGGVWYHMCGGVWYHMLWVWVVSIVLFTLHVIVNLPSSSRFANNYICALTETVKSIDTGLPPNLPVTF